MSKINENNISTHKQKYIFYKNLNGIFKSIDEKYINSVNNFIIKHNNEHTDEKDKIDVSHGIEHALLVLCHTEKALDIFERKISDEDILNIKLAALLHDIDDTKYFYKDLSKDEYEKLSINDKYKNAIQILRETVVSESNINKIIKMISYVSSSKNGDTIPKEYVDKEYFLYPRYADRLEALGIIGVERTLIYTFRKGEPICKEQEPKPDITIKQIYESIATLKRYKSYSKGSSTMIDHFYDKLLRLGKYPIRNKYFDEECAKRQKPLEDIVLLYERNGIITQEQIEKYIRENRDIVKCDCNDEIKTCNPKE